MKVAHLDRVHPFVIFWIGVLTGALVVGFVFLYKALNDNDYKSSLLYTSPTYSTLLKGTSLGSTSIGTPTGW